MNYLYYSTDLNYPGNKYNFSPSIAYPEYPFDPNEISKEKNYVYDAIRQMFTEMNLDKEHYGTPEWNPLLKWVKPGQNVVLKPNFVMHRNGSNDPEDLDSLVTHPSVIRCLLDYCFIALKGKGNIIVGDAPVKDCDFALLMEKGYYTSILEFYNKNKIPLEFVDFRGPGEEGGQFIDAGHGVLLNLGNKSWFYNCNHKANKYRIPNYDYRKVVKHHNGELQEYMINSVILEADVIINLPKPKTHRKNGYTGALKNFVGVNFSKEYLPHHTEGAVSQGGDEYKETRFIRDLSSKLRLAIDECRVNLNNVNEIGKKPHLLKKYHRILWLLYNGLLALDKKCQEMGKKTLSDIATEGCWYGNDTLWRTVLDLNYCVLYGTKHGIIDETHQRTIIHLGDMVISGESEGPMAPSPKKQHMLLFSENPVEFDCILTKIMGFDYTKLIGLKNAIGYNPLCEKEYNAISLSSNVKAWVGMLESVNFRNIISSFKPSLGWRGYVEQEVPYNEAD